MFRYTWLLVPYILPHTHYSRLLLLFLLAILLRFCFETWGFSGKEKRGQRGPPVQPVSKVRGYVLRRLQAAGPGSKWCYRPKVRDTVGRVTLKKSNSKYHPVNPRIPEKNKKKLDRWKSFLCEAHRLPIVYCVLYAIICVAIFRPRLWQAATCCSVCEYHHA